MKKKILPLLVFVLFVFYCNNEKSQEVRNTNQAGQEAAKKEELKKRVNALLTQANKMWDQERYDRALVSVDEALILIRTSSKEKVILKIMDYKYMILKKLHRFDEALKTAFEIEDLSQKVSQRKSPWNCLKIAEAYLGLKDKDNALKWVEKSVYERAFQKFRVLQSDDYKPISDHPRFIRVIKSIKDGIGLNKPARDFTVKLLNSEQVTLSSMKGKVVLIDFWDVICPPCRKEMPHLKQDYADYKDKGFEIIGISLDTDKNLLTDYIKEMDLQWPIACSFKGWSDKTAKLYKINATPSTWLIDRKGILRFYNLRGKELRAAIEQLIKES